MFRYQVELVKVTNHHRYGVKHHHCDKKNKYTSILLQPCSYLQPAVDLKVVMSGSYPPQTGKRSKPAGDFHLIRFCYWGEVNPPQIYVGNQQQYSVPRRVHLPPLDLGVTWVCVHDLTWHQNDLKVRLSHHLMTRLDLKFSWLKSATCTMTIIV